MNRIHKLGLWWGAVTLAAALPIVASATALAASPEAAATGTVDVVLSPSTATVLPGETLTVTVQIRAGAQQVDGLAAYLDFNPAVFRAVDLEGNPATAVDLLASPLNVVLENAVDNAAGRVDFSVGKLSGDKPSGTFDTAIIRFMAVTSTTTTSGISFAFDVPSNRYTDVTLAGSSVLRTASGGTYTVASGVLRGRVAPPADTPPPHPQYRMPLRVMLYRPGLDGPAFSAIVRTDHNARFALDGLLPGVYTVTVKHRASLVNMRRNVAIGDTSEEIDFCALFTGDATDDNAVGIRDFSALSRDFGAMRGGEEEWDVAADFDGNGQVNMRDFSLFASNYGRHGNQPCGQ